MIEGHEALLEKWRRFLKRPAEDRALIVRAALILPLTEIGLRLFGFRRWKVLIEKFSLPAHSPRSSSDGLQLETALRAMRAVHSIELHGPTTPNCLERSMALWWILRRSGVDTELQIGARKQGGRFEAHAWVELRGQVLNDCAEVHQHYVRFDAAIVPAAEESRAARKSVSD